MRTILFKSFVGYLVVTLVVYLSPVPYGYANPVLQNPAPNGGSNVASAGSATISNSGNSETINQKSQNAVIDWSSFNIGGKETTKFVDPTSSSLTVNRVHDMNASQILGTLSSNGNIVLINPNGVFFGKGSRVDVNGILATTSDVSNADVMAGGKLHFTPGGNSNATIENQGTITAQDAGLVGLVAPNVKNSGVITANLGKVQMSSGDTFTLDFYGDKLMEVAITDPAVTNQLVQNSGNIEADGGTVKITAAAARGIINSLITVSGKIETPAFQEHNGEILIYAEGSNAVKGNIADNKGTKPGTSTVLVSGKLDATNQSGTGGNISVLGDHVGILSGANIDASGTNGGGYIKIGGDFHGAGTTPTALATVVENGATINASATDNGNGGNVAVWSDNYTNFLGLITAKGGPNAGNGGFVETSGHKVLSLTDSNGHNGMVDASAPKGTPGTWLLDPDDLDIIASGDNNINNDGNGNISPSASDGSSTVGADTIVTALSTTNVVITTSSGKITIDADITSATANNLTLSAATDIINNGHTISLNGGSVAMNANQASGGGAIYMASGSQIITAGGNITMIGSGSDNNVNTSDGNLTLSRGIELNNTILDARNGGSGGNISLNGTGNNGGSGDYGIYVHGGSVIETDGTGTIALTGTGGNWAGSISPGIYITNGSQQDTIISGSGATTISSTDDIYLNNANIVSAGGAVVLDPNNANGGGAVSLTNSNITTSGGNITFGGGAHAATGDTNYAAGVNLSSSTLDAASTSGGNISITGIGASPGNFSGNGIAAGAIITNHAGTVTLSGTGGDGYGIVSATVTADTGAVSITGNNNGGVYSVSITANGAVTVNSNKDIALNSLNIGASGSSPIAVTINANGGANAIYMDGGNIETHGHDISLIGTGDSGYSAGVELLGVTIDARGAGGVNGNISITGTGDSGGGYGIYLHGGSVIVTGGGGTIGLTGTGGGGQQGIYATNGSRQDTITSGGGTIAVSSADDIFFNNANIVNTGGGVALTSNTGIAGGAILLQDSNVTTNGGAITISGTGGAIGDANYANGITLTGSTLDATSGSGGNITLAGVGYGSGTGYGITSDSAIRTSGTGSVSMTGTGTGIDLGVNVAGITAGSGGVSITGTGGVVTGNITAASTGGISITGPVTLTADTTYTTGSGTIGFSGTIDDSSNGTHSLALNTSMGSVSLGGAVGGGSALGSLSVSGSSAILGGNITTSNAGGGTGNVNITPAATITTGVTVDTTAGNGNITFSTIDDGNAAGTDSLTLNSGSGTISLNDNIGSSAHLNNLAVNSSHAVALGGNVTTSGTQAYNAPLTLGKTVTLDSSAGNSNITLGAAVDSAAGHHYGLTINAGTGTVALNTIGGTTSIGTLSITGGDIVTSGAIITNNADVTMTGSGAVALGGNITSNGGNIFLTGTGDVVYPNAGVYLNNITLDATGTGQGGNISVNGTGYSSGSIGLGIFGSTIKTNSNGTIALTGTGERSGGSYYGTEIDNASTITAANGSITITGTGAASDDIETGNATIKTTSGGDIDFIGTTSYGIDVSGSTIGGAQTRNISFTSDVAPTFANSPTITTSGTGSITFAPYTSNNTVTFSAGDNASGTVYIPQATLDLINTPTVIIGSAGAGAMTVGNYTWDSPITSLKLIGSIINFDTGTAITNTANANAVLTVQSTDIVMNSGASISGDGSHKLGVVFDADNGGNHSGYVDIEGNITTAGGNIYIGGGPLVAGLPSGSAYGITTQTDGVLLNGNLDATNSGTGGNISIKGIGYNSSSTNNGIETYGTITTDGTGTINLNGTGSGDDEGVGVSLGANVSTTGNGTITLNGTGADGVASNYGVFVGLGIGVTSTGGSDISITGNGGNGSGNFNVGVAMARNAVVTTTGMGTIAINGTGSGSGSDEFGVYLAAHNTVSTDNGNIIVTGSGSASGISTDSGVAVSNAFGGGTIKTTGIGNITINGIPGTGGTTYGVVVANANAIQTTGSGSITISTDSIKLSQANDINSIGNLTVAEYTATTPITVGSGASGLVLSDTTLGYMTWGSGKTLTIGDTNAGNMTVNSADTALLNTGNLTLISNGSVTLTALAAKSSGGTSTLTAQAGTDIIDNATIASSGGGNLLNVLFDSNYAAGGGAITDTGNITSNGGYITMGGGSAAITAGSGYAVGTASNPQGILINGATVSSDAGNIIMNGTGYSGSGIGDLDGIWAIGSSVIESTSGNITMHGLGGAGDTAGTYYGNVGIGVGEHSTVSSGTGVMSLTGTGGSGPGNVAGVAIYHGGSIQSTETGSTATKINITGISGVSTTSYAYGIGLDSDSGGNGISTNDGSVVLAGTSNNTFSSAYNAGVGGFNNNIYVNGAGNVTITGTAGTGGNDLHFNGTTIGGGLDTGNVTFNANTIEALLGPLNVTTTGNVTFAPRTATTTIGVANDNETLNIDTGILSNITAGSITIGRTNGTGNITVGTQTLGSNTTIQTSSGNIEFTGAQTDGTKTLTAVTTSGNITLDQNAKIASTANSGNSIVLAAGGNFINNDTNDGANAVVAGTGTATWHIYSTAAGSDTHGASTLLPTTTVNSTTYPTTTGASGNTWFYSSATTPENITLTETAQTVTYGAAGDAVGSVAVTYTCTAGACGDIASLSGGTITVSGTLNSTNTYYTANTVHTMTLSGVGITWDNGFSTGTITYNTGALTVNQATLTVTAAATGATNKVYDGTTAAAGVNLSDNRVAGDVLTVANTGITFSDKNVANGKTVTVAGLSISGADAANYTLAANTATTTANITTKSITITANAQGATYGDTLGALTYTNTALAAGDSFSGALSTNGHVAGVVLSHANNFDVSHGAYAIGQGTLGISDGNSGNNYAITYVGDNLTLSAKGITVTATAGQSVIYGNNIAALTYGVNAGGLVGADTLSGTLTTAHGGAGTAATHTNRLDVGNYAITQGTLTNSNNTNYAITYAGDNLAVTQRAITVTAATNTKGYDNTNTAAATGTITAGSLAAGDTAPAWSETYANVNAGTNKTLNASGTVTDGNGGGNYAVTFVADTTGVINQRAITVTAQANTKGYDGSASSATLATLTGGTLAAGDTATWTEVYANKNAGAGKNITASADVVTDGNGGGNYAVTFVDNNAGVINTRAITVTAQANTKTYDGDTSSATLATLTGGTLAAGDTATWTQVYDNKNAGAGKNLTASADAVTDGNGGGNYAVTFVDNNAGVVNQAALTVTADNKSKNVGDANPALTSTITGFVGGEILATSGVAGAADLSTLADISSAAGPYDINAALGTLTASNYSFGTFTKGILTVTALAAGGGGGGGRPISPIVPVVIVTQPAPPTSAPVVVIPPSAPQLPLAALPGTVKIISEDPRLAYFSNTANLPAGASIASGGYIQAMQDVATSGVMMPISNTEMNPQTHANVPATPEGRSATGTIQMDNFYDPKNDDVDNPPASSDKAHHVSSSIRYEDYDQEEFTHDPRNDNLDNSVQHKANKVGEEKKARQQNLRDRFQRIVRLLRAARNPQTSTRIDPNPNNG